MQRNSLVTNAWKTASASAAFALFLAPSAFAANLDFTIPTSGFAVQSYNLAASTTSLPTNTIVSGNIVKEAGFADILLDVTGENLDIFISDIASGNPYFDADSGGPGGLGSCRTLTASAQCSPSSDDNLTISAEESLKFEFRTDDGATTSANFGNFFFSNDDHKTFSGDIQVTNDLGSMLIAVTDGIADFSGLSGSTFLIFNDQNDTTNNGTGNYYISQANISEVPLPPAVLLLSSALIGFAGISRRKKS